MSKLDDLLYESGLTAQGSLDQMDEYDQQAINKLVQLVINECVNIVENNRKFAHQHKWSATELANVCLYEIDKTFEVNEDGKETVSG
jgi:hypothetical protein